MPWRSLAIEKLLHLSLSEKEYRSIIFWTDCLYKSVQKGTAFRHLVIGSEFLYTIDHAHWKVERECHISQIASLRIAGDVAPFLQCKITGTYNHIILIYLEHPLINVNKNGDNGDSINDAEETENVSDPTADKYILTTQSVSKRVDIYLKDRNLIAFRILYEAMQADRERKHGFKSILQQLLEFPGIHAEVDLSNEAGDVDMTDFRSSCQRKSVVLAFMAQDDDLAQLMPYFKPITSRSRWQRDLPYPQQTNCASPTKPIALDKWINQWIDASKRIVTELHFFDPNSPTAPMHLTVMIYNQFIELNQRIQCNFEVGPGDGITYLPAMFFIVDELSFFLQRTDLIDLMDTDLEVDSDRLEQVATRRASELQLMLVMLDTIRLFVEHYHPPNRSCDVDKHSSVPLIQWHWENKWVTFISRAIPVLLIPPRLPVVYQREPQVDSPSSLTQTDHERCLYTNLNSVMIASQDWDKKTDRAETPSFSQLYYLLISDLNTEVACILFEMLAMTSSAFGPHPMEPTYQWISNIFDESIHQSEQRDPLMLNRLSSHACSKLHLLCSLQSEVTHNCSAVRMHLEDIVRTLFLIDWLTCKHLKSKSAYRSHGFTELSFWFRPGRVFPLFHWIRKLKLNASEVRLTKCAIVVLTSRIYGRLTGRSRAHWAELDRVAVHDEDPQCAE